MQPLILDLNFWHRSFLTTIMVEWSLSLLNGVNGVERIPHMYMVKRMGNITWRIVSHGLVLAISLTVAG